MQHNTQHKHYDRTMCIITTAITKCWIKGAMGL